jgi:integrase
LRIARLRDVGSIRLRDIDIFYGGWDLGARAKGKRLGTLRAFFRFCMNRRWLPENPSAPISSRLWAPTAWQIRRHNTDEELQRIIDACDNLRAVVWSNGRENGVYTGEDVKDFIWADGVYGLRISDVGLFNMSRLKGNEVFLRAKKNGETYSRTSRIGCGTGFNTRASGAAFVLCRRSF